MDEAATNGDQVGTKWDQVETNSKILISIVFRRFLEVPKAKIHIFQWFWKVSWGPKWDQVGPKGTNADFSLASTGRVGDQVGTKWGPKAKMLDLSMDLKGKMGGQFGTKWDQVGTKWGPSGTKWDQVGIDWDQVGTKRHNS